MLPLSEKYIDYANQVRFPLVFAANTNSAFTPCFVDLAHRLFVPNRQVAKRINAAGYHVDVDESDDQLGKKVALAQVAQYNLMLVVGGVRFCSTIRLCC